MTIDDIPATTQVQSWRPYSVRSALARRLIPNVDFTLTLTDGLRLKANLKTHFGLFRHGNRDHEVATARAIAATAPPGGVIYDLGANIGLYTVVFASDWMRKVISFEPSALVLPYLRHNIALNRLSNVQVQPIAISDRRGTIRFTLDETTTCTSHVSAPEEAGIPLECSDLDSLVQDQQLPAPDLVKLDVEGHDQSILRGMSRILTTVRPVVCLEGGLRSSSGEIASLRFLQEADYTIWDLNRQRELRTDTLQYVVVAIPKGSDEHPRH